MLARVRSAKVSADVAGVWWLFLAILLMPQSKIIIEQIGSPIRNPSVQRKTLIGLRLNKIGRIAELPDTPEIRGMINKVSHLVRIIYTSMELDIFVEEVVTEYRDILTGDGSRVVRGAELWKRFKPAVDECHAGYGRNDGHLIECVNEMAVAKALVEDAALASARIEYEPNLLADGRKIDFVVDRGKDYLYVEVKTVRPKTKATAEAYQKYEERRKRHPKNVDFVVDPRWEGGAVYGDSFASRAHFLEYTMAFEERLEAAKLVQPGPGVLVFCGNGFAWNNADLEDWADFYFLGKHRADDHFGPMERHHIKTTGIKLKRNVDHFAWLKRPFDRASITELVFPICGPIIGR